MWYERYFQEIKEYIEKGHFHLALDKCVALENQLSAITDDVFYARLWQLRAVIYQNIVDHQNAVKCWYEMSKCNINMEDKGKAYSNFLFDIHYSHNTISQLRKYHNEYQELLENIVQYDHKNHDCNKTKIRIGYLSADFSDHIVTNFTIQLLAAYNRRDFEVYAYHCGQKNIDNTSRQLEKLVDCWRDLRDKDYAKAAEVIYEDSIDILMSTGGHSNGGEELLICAYKPAPIQICGIGWFDTTGMSAMDYFLSDVYCTPDGHGADQFCEKLLRLPHTHFCYTPSERFLHTKGQYQLQSNIMFGSFNNIMKISKECLNAWHQIISLVPNSKLLLKNMNHRQRAIVKKRLRQAGFWDEQYVLQEASADYLNEYYNIDIALDTFPYPGGGTTCEALYMGVPVISYYEERHGSRFGYSLLKNIGLEQLASDTVAGYIDTAVALANDRELLNLLHQNLRSMMKNSPIMQPSIYLNDIEDAYRAIWQEYCRERNNE